MILFYTGLAIIFIGLGSVAWLLYMERKNNQPAPEEAEVRPAPKETPGQLLSRVGLADGPAEESDLPQKKNPFSGLLSKFKKKKEEPTDFTSIEAEPRMRITKDILQTGTASVRLVAPVPDEAALPAEDLPPQISTHTDHGTKEKNLKLEALLAEKNDALEKAEKALAIELKNKKEFNKIKDLLEKELKDDKVKYRDLQVQIGTAQMDTNTYKNRVNQLELKVSKLEKTVTEMEHQIKERDEKIFDRETKLKELTEKLSTKDKLETIKVQAEPPAEPPAASEHPPVVTLVDPAPIIIPEPDITPVAIEIPVPELIAPPAEPNPPTVSVEPAQIESGGEATSLKLPPDILTPSEPETTTPATTSKPELEPTPPPEDQKPEQSNPSP